MVTEPRLISNQKIGGAELAKTKHAVQIRVVKRKRFDTRARNNVYTPEEARPASHNSISSLFIMLMLRHSMVEKLNPEQR